MFTEAVCSEKSKTRCHWEPCSRQMKTLPSKPAEARMLPYLGWAQETHQTAPSWLWVLRQSSVKALGEVLTNPFNVSVRRWLSPSTSKIFTVRSEEQVARRRP
jgi:hypothetical protein